jgi:acyl-coenzyme A synthetase/AMP-(fatty) acid ligase
LRKALGQQPSAPHQRAERLEVVAKLPRTPSGKVQKLRRREFAKEFARALV